METQGMVRGRYFRRTRLLRFTLPFLLICALPFSGALSQEDQPGLALELQTSGVPVLRSVWTLTILVDYPQPAEVSVRPPPFPDALRLDQVRTSLRVVQDRDGRERRLTAVEYLFIPRTAGSIILAPFEVITPGGRALTRELSLRIPGPAPASRFRFQWAAPPSFLPLGQGTELVLKATQESGGPSSNPLPPGYQPDPPENAILEVLPLGDRDQHEGIVLRLRVIPLRGKELVLPLSRFSRDGVDMEIPSIRIPLRVASPQAFPRSPSTAGESAALPSGLSDLPTPRPFAELQAAAEKPAAALFRGRYPRILEQIEELWDKGQWAEALAEIRRNERENASGPGLRSLRREMEKELRIEDGEDEAWQPRRLLLIFLPGDLALICLLLGGRLLKKRPLSTKGSRWHTRLVVFLLVLLIPVLLFLVVGALEGRGGESSAVVREAPVYRIPDAGGEVEALLDEGCRVWVRSTAGSWVHVESPGGINGWVSRDAVIIY